MANPMSDSYEIWLKGAHHRSAHACQISPLQVGVEMWV